jgi:hypothetical protein
MTKKALDAALHREREVGIFLAEHGYRVCRGCAAKMVCTACKGRTPDARPRRPQKAYLAKQADRG